MALEIRPNAVAQDQGPFFFPGAYIGPGPFPTSVSGLRIEGAGITFVGAQSIVTTSGDLILNPVGDVSFADGNIVNVGEIDLDLIRADAANGSITIELDNAAGADLIVGNNNALVVAGNTDRVGIGTNPATRLHMLQSSSDGFRIERSGSETMEIALVGTNRLRFYNVNDAREDIVIRDSGRIGMGDVTSPSGALHIGQLSTTAAIPVLFLDQKDVSEQCIQFSSDATDRDINLFTVDVTGAPKLMWDESEDMFAFTKGILINSNNELRFYDNGNYVGFEAPALSADQIWILPDEDGVEGAVLSTDGSGNLQWDADASEKSWAFMSRDANSGINYIGGYYKFGTSDNDFNPSITFGTANASYAAHFFLVQAAGGAGGIDTVIRITGTSITDAGVRAAADTEDLTVDDAGAAGTYYETTKKWIGQVTIAKQSGPDLLCNYGFCKYWDNNNSDFKVLGFEATWLGAKNDATPDILLRHHKATGWTYNNAAAPTPPTEIASMATDHNTEIRIRVDEEGAWKRANLSTVIGGSGGEGTIIELITTTNRTFAIGNFILRIAAQ
jgi:hypothetical protein